MAKGKNPKRLVLKVEVALAVARKDGIGHLGCSLHVDLWILFQIADQVAQNVDSRCQEVLW